MGKLRADITFDYLGAPRSMRPQTISKGRRLQEGRWGLALFVMCSTPAVGQGCTLHDVAKPFARRPASRIRCPRPRPRGRERPRHGRVEEAGYAARRPQAKGA